MKENILILKYLRFCDLDFYFVLYMWKIILDKNSDISENNGEGKENSPAAQVKNDQNNEKQVDNENNSDKTLSEAANEFKKYKVAYEEEGEDTDSDEDNHEEEDEKENTRNRLKALLGGSSSSPKSKPSQNSPTLRRENSPQNTDENYDSDFLDTIEKMRDNLYSKLEIWEPEDEDDEDSMNVSKLFYEGREGQKYTVKVLDKFFTALKTQAVNFTQKVRFENEKSEITTEKVKL